MAKLGSMINRRFDTWAVQEEVHRNLMGDIKTFAQEAFREGKKHGMWICEQDAIVSQSKVAEHQKREYLLQLQMNVLEAKYNECKKRLVACDYVHLADDDFMELLLTSMHNHEPDIYLPEDSLYRYLRLRPNGGSPGPGSARSTCLHSSTEKTARTARASVGQGSPPWRSIAASLTCWAWARRRR